VTVNPTTAATSLQSGEVATAVQLVTMMARSYTRGRGFTADEPCDEIAAVIATASARQAWPDEPIGRDEAQLGLEAPEPIIDAVIVHGSTASTSRPH
jgi:hypothetical protein